MSDHHSKSTTNRRTLLAGLRHLALDEDGAAYTLSYVMVIPMYALLICTIVEMTLMLTSKLGTVYAAYAAARSASVWSSATEWEKVQEKAKRAAIQAMVPFASGTQPLANTVLTGTLPDDIADATVDAGFYWGAYQLYAKRPVPTEYLTNKYVYATVQTEVEIEGPPEKWDDDIKVKVKYKFPFNVPGVGRIIGKPGIDGRYYFTIESTVSIPNEGTQNDDNSIGIGYGKLD
jgi:Flp pilus assembly protein TadG